MLPAVTGALPRFVVCEDGTRVPRPLQPLPGRRLRRSSRRRDFESARAAAAGADGLLLDLDFRRTPPERLVDERGRRAGRPRRRTRRRRLAETQGILILRQLRAAGVTLPAVLFADLDDDERARFLERTLAPLTIGSSHLGIREIGALLRRRARRPPAALTAVTRRRARRAAR